MMEQLPFSSLSILLSRLLVMGVFDSLVADLVSESVTVQKSKSLILR